MPGYLYLSLAKTVESHPKKNLLIFSERTLTSTQFFNEVKCCISFLIKSGFSKGDVIFNAMGTSIEFCVLLYAANALGIIVVPISTKIKTDEFQMLLGQLMPKVVFFDEDVQPFVNELLPAEKRISLRLFSDFRAYDRIDIPLTDGVKGSDPALLMFTSGTTSAPKGAVISNNNIKAAIEAYKDALKLSDLDSTILGVPIFHITGLIAILGLFVDIGGSIYLEKRFNAKEILQLIKEKNITFLHGSPTVFALLHKEYIKNGATSALLSLKSIACGAGRLNQGIIQSLKHLFPNADVHSVYGLTESTSPFTIYRGDISNTKNCESSGTPSLGAKIQIRDDKGNILPANHPGHIFIAGPMVITHYFPNNESTKSLFDKEFLNTGDIGLLSDSGELFVKDRVKDVINRGGEKVFCPEVESIISTYPNIVEVALVAKNDEIYGEIPVAFIIANQDQKEIDHEDFKNFMKQHLAAYQRPVELYFVDELPRTNNGKINKRKLREIVNKDMNNLAVKDSKQLKIVVAMDSFKGSCSAYDAGQAVATGIKRSYPNAEIINLPISDGGEGLLLALQKTLEKQGYINENVNTIGAYGEETTSIFIHNDRCCVIEMAQTCGLDKYPKETLNVKVTTTYGLGQVVNYALEKGIENFRIGLGGSATNDGGAGFAQALGAKFYDINGNEIDSPIRSIDLIRIHSIDISGLNPKLSRSNFIGTCDVSNPMLGVNGATYIFGPQKGANEEDIINLEAGMAHYADILNKTFAQNRSEIPGSGAAGALGGGLLYFCHARLQSGIETVLDLIDFNKYMEDCDLVIVGEGRMDGQSANGKAPVGVALRAKTYGIPTVAICGGYTQEARVLYDYNIESIFSICNGPMSLDYSMRNACNLIESAAENLIRTFLLKR